jgi:hypothetical protein
VDRDVVDVDATLGQQFLDIPVGQPEPQIPAHREHDHIRWEAEPGERRTTQNPKIGPPRQLHAACRMTTRPASVNATDPSGL